MPVHVCFLKLDQRLSCVAYKNIYVCRCVCVCVGTTLYSFVLFRFVLCAPAREF